MVRAAVTRALRCEDMPGQVGVHKSGALFGALHLRINNDGQHAAGHIAQVDEVIARDEPHTVKPHFSVLRHAQDAVGVGHAGHNIGKRA